MPAIDLSREFKKQKILDIASGREWLAYLDSGLFLWFVVFSLIYALCVLPWCIVYELGYLSGGFEYAGMFEFLPYVVAFAFYPWLSSHTSGYTTQPELYCRLLFKFDELHQWMSAYMDAAIENCSDMSRQSDRGQVASEDAVKLFVHRRNMKMYVIWMAKHSINLFTGEDIRQDRSPITRYENPVEAIQDVLRKTVLTLNNLKMETYCASGAVQFILDDVRAIRSTLEQVDTSKRVVDPPVKRNMIQFIIFSIFLLWLPFRMSLSGGWAAMAFYPLLMDILTGQVIISYWLRGPFDPFRPIQYMDFVEWEREILQRIDDRDQIQPITKGAGIAWKNVTE
jgi:hypothetical protein